MVLEQGFQAKWLIRLSLLSLTMVGILYFAVSDNIRLTIVAPVDYLTVRAPVDIGTIAAPVHIGTINAPVEIGTSNAPEDIGTINAPVDIGTINAPEDIGTINAPVDIGLTINAPVDNLTINAPVYNLRINAPVVIKHLIVAFKPPSWIHIKQKNDVLSKKCAFKNCRVTTNTTNLRNQSAILYALTAAPDLPTKPPISPSDRNPDQVWIFCWAESPVNHIGGRRIYQNEHWRHTVNWTMTYTQDADIFMPYGHVTKRQPPSRNYTEIFQRKTKLAAWIVSNCQTKSKRERYVDELRTHGVAVDVFGKCAGKRADPKETKRIVGEKYKFYLSFENSLCKDYITEKFFSYSKLDVVLVVRGGGNYSNLLPSNAFINTADFKHIGDLAKYMLTVASDERLYTSYLKHKDHFNFTSSFDSEKSICEICEKLNNIDKNRKVYTDLLEKVHNGTCTEPRDIV